MIYYYFITGQQGILICVLTDNACDKQKKAALNL